MCNGWIIFGDIFTVKGNKSQDFQFCRITATVTHPSFYRHQICSCGCIFRSCLGVQELLLVVYQDAVKYQFIRDAIAIIVHSSRDRRFDVPSETILINNNKEYLEKVSFKIIRNCIEPYLLKSVFLWVNIRIQNGKHSSEEQDIISSTDKIVSQKLNNIIGNRTRARSEITITSHTHFISWRFL